MSNVASIPGFTLVQLRYFAAAAELGSMTAAARELMVSQSAVSTAVAQLEKELGVQLLLRHHARGLTLTAAGKSFHHEVRNFLVHTNELAETARGQGNSLVGGLAVGCFSTLAPFLLPTLLSRYAEKYPNVDVDVVEAEHARLKKALRSGDVEVALMYGYDIDSDIDYAVADQAAPYVLIAKTHRLARRRRVSLSELADDPMVLLDLPHSSAYFETIIESTGITPIIRHRSPGYETVRSLVAHGHGYSILNQHPAHNLTYDGSEVVTLELRDEIQPLEIVIAVMRDVQLTNRAKAFVKATRLSISKIDAMKQKELLDT
ncbi:MAG TPA: LysR family transcriptional regulator [Actinomycetes bacterium]|nr:LysR family transcriptional regulator [Actinomycetes bacterium]